MGGGLSHGKDFAKSWETAEEFGLRPAEGAMEMVSYANWADVCDVFSPFYDLSLLTFECGLNLDLGYIESENTKLVVALREASPDISDWPPWAKKLHEFLLAGELIFYVE